MEEKEKKEDTSQTLQMLFSTGNPIIGILRLEDLEKGKDVDFDRDEDLNEIYHVRKFIDDVKCFGLAANQLIYDGKNLNKNFIVMKYKDGNKVFVNPTITRRFGMSRTLVEYSLSCSEKKIYAKRFLAIETSYIGLDGKPYKKIMKDQESQVFQHLVDSLKCVEFKFELEKKLDRNSLCHCGSGKKYKKCCGG